MGHPKKQGLLALAAREALVVGRGDLVKQKKEKEEGRMRKSSGPSLSPALSVGLLTM